MKRERERAFSGGSVQERGSGRCGLVEVGSFALEGTAFSGGCVLDLIECYCMGGY